MKQVILSTAIALLMGINITLFSQVAINTDGSAPSSSSMLDIKSTSAGLLVPRMTLSERDLITNPATGLIIYQTDETSGFYYYNGTAWAAVSGGEGGGTGHYVGTLFGGGVVFWVDHTGQHGLIVSMIDLSISQAWSNITTALIGLSAQSEWDGLSNSNTIVGQTGHTNSAAKLCLDYVNTDYGTGIYSDWYLPARGELNHLWNNIFEVHKALENDGNPATSVITKNNYWSSSEHQLNSSAYFQFGIGTSGFANKGTNSYVRSVRAF